MTKRPKTHEIEAEPPDEFLVAVGRRVRVARDHAGLTLAQLGEASGMAPSYIYTLEKEGANLTLKTLQKIAEVLKLGPRDLMPESDQDALSSLGVASLVAALDRATAVLAERQSQESAILEKLKGFARLQVGLKRLASGTKDD